MAELRPSMKEKMAATDFREFPGHIACSLPFPRPSCLFVALGRIDLKNRGRYHDAGTIYKKMIDVIEKLLILQDRDRHILRVETELAHIGPERENLQAKAAGTQAILDAAKTRGKQIESDRKKLELDVEAKKQQIEKYANQQFQTKKNEEYRALAHEIETCKADIVKLDDQQIVLMERAEQAQKDVLTANVAATQARQVVEGQIGNLAARETNLEKELAELELNRQALAQAVEEGVRAKYERLRRTKGSNVVVGVEHGVCGGCHMKLPTQIMVLCRGQQEVVTCINCGRILYYTRDMDLAVSD